MGSVVKCFCVAGLEWDISKVLEMVKLSFGDCFRKACLQEQFFVGKHSGSKKTIHRFLRTKLLPPQAESLISGSSFQT